MEYISFCSGIEAASQAWEQLGWNPKAFCEIDKFPSKVLDYHYPDVPNLGDFTAVDWSQWSADVCVGGTPCQAFSVAGLRKSLSDERGNLSLEFIRAVNIIRPRFVVWENVPGVLSTPDNAFGCFLAGLVGCEEPIVFEQGWPNAGVVDGPIRRCAWRVLDAQYFGLAQRRRRVFVVASVGDGPHPAEILFEWEGLRRDSPPCREAGEGFTHEFAPSLTSSGRGVERGGDSRGQDPVIAMCLNAGGMGRIDAESETLIAYSLRADGFDAGEDGTKRGTPLVPMAVMENQRGETRLSEAADALTKGGGKPGQGYAAAMVPICWDEDLNARVDLSGTMSRGGDGGRHAGVAVPVACGVADTLGVGANQTTGFKTDIAAQGMAVRRLTPRECERLQGFPDDYTNIPGAADGPRYKALGNSMAVPVMRWIGQRIQDAIK